MNKGGKNKVKDIENSEVPSKKAKKCDDEYEDFDFELALADEESMNIADENDGPETWQTYEKWSRPTLGHIDHKVDNVVFQQIDIDHYLGEPFPGMPGPKLAPVSIMRMYGVTMEGNSVCCHVHGFCPYFYIICPRSFEKVNCDDFRIALDKAVLKDMRSNKENLQETVLEVEIVERLSIMNYLGDEKQRFIKITMALPKLLAPAKRILEKEIVMNEFDFQDCRAFENNVDIDIRFMVDTGVVGCSWIEVPRGTYTIRSKSSKHITQSRSQLEIDVAFDKFIAHEPEGEWAKVAPFRILSFDIECAGRRGIFPEPKVDPVIQIANMIIRQGEQEPFIRNCFTLKECAPIVGSQILCYDKEAVSFFLSNTFRRYKSSLYKK